jgi:hypothetical protein
MSYSHLRRAGLLVVPVSCAALLSACGTVVVDKSSETSLTRKALTVSNAPATKTIDCPSDVPLKLGKTMTCHVDFKQGGGADFTMKIDKVNGHHGHLTIVAAKRTT